MKNPAFRTALLFAGLAGAFILIDLAMDRLMGGTPELNLPHLILAAIVLPTCYFLMKRGLEARDRAEAVLRQARDELETRVRERTVGLARANEALQAEIAERKRTEHEIANLAKFPAENPHPILRLSQDGVVLYANEASDTLLQEWSCGIGDYVPEFWRNLVAAVFTSRLKRTVDVECDARAYSFVVAPVTEADYVNLYGIDITERKRVEEERERLLEQNRQQRKLLETMFEADPDGLAVMVGAELVLRLVNPAYWAHTPHPELFPGGQRYEQIWPDVQDAQRLDTFQHVLATGEPVDIDCEERMSPDGRTHYFSLHARRLPWNGEQAVLVVLQDITAQEEARRRADEAAQEAQRRADELDAVFAGMTDAVVVYDAKGVSVRANPAAVAACGFDPVNADSFVAARLLSIRQPDGRSVAVDKLPVARALHGETVRGERFLFTNLDRRDFIILASASPLSVGGRVSGAVSVWHDVTELEQAEKKLHKALEESRHRQAEISALLAGSRAVLEHRDFRPAAQSIFDACKNLLGATGGYVALLSEDGTQNEPVFLDSGHLPCTVDPALPMPIRGLRERVYRTGRAAYDNNFSASEWTQFLPEGHACLDSVLFAPLAIKGIVVGLIGLANKPGGFTDNDARLASAFGELAALALFNSRTLEMLENSKERFRSVVQTANDAVITIDNRGNIVFWNTAAESIYGYTANEMMGQPAVLIMPERSRKAHQDGLARVVSTRQSSLVGRTVEMVGLRKDGAEFPAELSLAKWETREGAFFTSIIRDITERKRSEEALRQAQEELTKRIQERTAMEERQRLARELHDSVSQALYGISLGAHTALTLLDSDRVKVIEALNYVLSLAQAGLMEMRALIFELRPESLEMEGLVIGLNKQAAALQARYGIEVRLELCDEPGVPFAVKEALYRIAQEALQNAVKHARPDRLDVHMTCGAASVGLEVCDNGVGFDPMAAYPGHLGLRSMRERAMSLGGTLEIASVSGCGTQIRVCIPVPTAQPA